MSFEFIRLLAQATPPKVTKLPQWYEEWYGLVGILIAIVFVSVVAGKALAGAVRMKDYAWKISLVLFATLAATAVIVLGVAGDRVKGGIDLAGGTILIYELDQEKKQEVLERTPDLSDLMKKLVGAVSRRLDPAGVKQVTIRQIGSEQIEIIIPKVTPAEVRQIKRSMESAGNLEFRILADRQLDGNLIARAEATSGNLIRDKDEDASKSDDRHIVLIREALKNEDKKKVERSGRTRARWVLVPENKRREVASNDDLVTRGSGANLEQLVIVGQVRAQWIKIGENEDRQPRVDVSGGFWPTRLRDDGGLETLVIIDEFHVNGSYLTHARQSFRDGNWTVEFHFNAAGANRFGTLTMQNYRPQGRKRRLGIVLDEELLSAPNLNAVIRDTGEITGDFSKEEVEWLVGILNAGSLPAALAKEPIGEDNVSPILGEITIKKGSRAIAYSLIGILVFMPIYYRFSGLVAGFALVLNLLLVVGVMIAVGAAFTLPGLAGLVLTVGMAVDANVLIFERIREERQRGSALRMAIRNGFGRATRTIVDANMTTLIIGIVLYWIGTDQLRGFAVTLILGILMSMFTAIFCARIFFDIAERKRWITQLNMTRIVGKTEFDFLAKRHLAAAFSLVLIGVGLYGVYDRGKDLFDIDFVGGSRVEVQFNDEIVSADVEASLRAYSENLAQGSKLDDLKTMRTGDENKTVIVETTQQDLRTVEEAIKNTFEGKLRTNNIHFDPAQIRTIETEIKAEREAGDIGLKENGAAEDATTEDATTVGKDSEPAAGNDAEDGGDKSGDQPSGDDGVRRNDLPSSSLIALGQEAEIVGENRIASDVVASLGFQPDEGSSEPSETGTETSDQAEPTGDERSSDESGADTGDTAEGSIEETSGDTSEESPASQSDETEPEKPQSGTDDQPPAPSTTIPQPPPAGTLPKKPPRFAGGTEIDVTFDDEINQETLTALLKQFISSLSLPMPDLQVTSDEVIGESIKPAKQWKVQSTLSETELKSVLARFEADMQDQPIFGASTNIRGQIAGDMRNKAVKALIASLLCIVAYIWVRFQRVTYGLAAVVALVHDVLVTVGAIALSAYIFNIPVVADFLLIERFKLSLTVLAAFLTIIGYSLNDTIVIFDRIREVRGKSPRVTHEIINTSINQTLSRTMLTSLTTLIVVMMLYFIGGPGIHGFAYALVIGVMVGTYSSMFVASPVLLWMSEMGKTADTDATVAKRSSAPAAG